MARPRLHRRALGAAHGGARRRTRRARRTGRALPHGGMAAAGAVRGRGGGVDALWLRHEAGRTRDPAEERGAAPAGSAGGGRGRVVVLLTARSAPCGRHRAAGPAPASRQRAGAAGGPGPRARLEPPVVPRTVLILHSSAGRYGADLQLLAIAEGLDPDRWRVVCVLPERGELGGLLEAAGAQVVVHPLAVLRRSGMGVQGAGRLARAALRDRNALGALARDHHVALVHSNTSVVLSGGAIARAAGVPHLLHVREIYEGAGGQAAAAAWPFFRRRLLRADGVVCISQAVAAQFGDSRQASVIHDGLPRAPEEVPRRVAREVLGLPS